MDTPIDNDYNTIISEFLQRGNRFPISTLLFVAPMKERDGFDYDAMIIWNKILTDDKTKVTAAHAYMSRAKIFYLNKQFRSAYHNVVLSEANGMIGSFVDAFKKLCLASFDLELISRDYKFLKLTYKANDHLPWIVYCLRLCRDSAFKPSIVADKKLKIGDVVCVEKAVFGIAYDRDHPNEIVEVDTTHQRCYHCFQHNGLDLITCDGCDLVMFCSQDCQDIANMKYHNYECIINATDEKVKHIVRSMRPFFCALFYFNHDIDALMAFALSRNNQIKTIFDYDFSDGPIHENTFNWLHIFDSIQAPEVTDLSSILPTIFNSHPVLSVMWTNHQKFLLPYLNHHADILCFIGRDLYQWPGHSQPLMEFDSQKKAIDLIRVQKIVGSLSFTLSSLLDQCCKPNIYRHMYKDNEMYYIVARNINKGEKLTIYNKDALYFARLPDAERLQQLKVEFSGICTCNNCPEPAASSSSINYLNDDEIAKLPDRIGVDLYYWHPERAYKAFLTIMDNLKRNNETMAEHELLIQEKRAFLQLQFSCRPTLPFKFNPLPQ